MWFAGAQWCASVLLVLALLGCSASSTKGSGAAGPVDNDAPVTRDHDLFPEPNADFDQYREQVRAFITPRSLSHRTAAAIELNLPFERTANPQVPYRGRFLLFHGLNDSAYVWHDIAEELASRGFDTRAVLFEGHGSTPEDMLNVSHKSWLRSARRHFALWSDDNVPIYLGGFSMGAVIATLLALEHPEDIAGLLLISPAYHSRLNHYLRWSGLYSYFRPWVFGGMIMEDNPMKYNSIPVNSGTQFFNVTQTLKRRWDNHRVDIPTLMIASEDDSVVDIDWVRKVYRRRFVNERRRLLIYRQEPLQTVPAKEESRTSRFLDKRILSQSHLGLMNAPGNPLFGEQAKILVCNGNEYPIFMACMRATGHTTYNPDFDTLMQRFDEVFPASEP